MNTHESKILYEMDKLSTKTQLTKTKTGRNRKYE